MNVEKIFGTRVFDDSAMKKRLPQKVYQSLLRTRRLGQPLDPQIADVVACAMKEWHWNRVRPTILTGSSR